MNRVRIAVGSTVLAAALAMPAGALPAGAAAPPSFAGPPSSVGPPAFVIPAVGVCTPSWGSVVLPFCV